MKYCQSTLYSNQFVHLHCASLNFESILLRSHGPPRGLCGSVSKLVALQAFDPDSAQHQCGRQMTQPPLNQLWAAPQSLPQPSRLQPLVKELWIGFGHLPRKVVRPNASRFARKTFQDLLISPDPKAERRDRKGEKKSKHMLKRCPGTDTIERGR